MIMNVVKENRSVSVKSNLSLKCVLEICCLWPHCFFI